MQGIWPEDPTLARPCVDASECPIYQQSFGPTGKYGNGLYSGSAGMHPHTVPLTPARTCTNNACDIFAWGPVETQAQEIASQAPGYYAVLTQVHLL